MYCDTVRCTAAMLGQRDFGPFDHHAELRNIPFVTRNELNEFREMPLVPQNRHIGGK